MSIATVPSQGLYEQEELSVLGEGQLSEAGTQRRGDHRWLGTVGALSVGGTSPFQGSPQPRFKAIK